MTKIKISSVEDAIRGVEDIVCIGLDYNENEKASKTRMAIGHGYSKISSVEDSIWCPGLG